MTLTTIRRIKAPKRPKTDLQRLQDKARRQKHENAFEFLWKAIGGPELKREHRFCERMWRFDFAHQDTRTAIEIEGGVWTKGRHNTGAGFSEDRVKYNRAALLGWHVFSLTPDMITREHVEPIRDHIQGILMARSHS